MIPGVNDPKWGRFLDSLGTAKVQNLPTKMMFNRIKLRLGFDSSETMRKQVIAEIHDYLVKNENTLQDDIKAIFGR